MNSLPEYLETGERARLFPVLAETSKEGRSTSILLSCLASIQPFGRSVLSSVGQKLGKTARVEAYTEIVFRKSDAEKHSRPDGLITVRTGSREWRAIIEAKIGSAHLQQEQVEAYLRIAKQHRVDAVITISNDFAASPLHHPLPIAAKSKGKVEIFHWSWMYLLTQANLLLSNHDVTDTDQEFVLREMVRFLSHPSAGVRGFEQMPGSWTELVQRIVANDAVSSKSAEAAEVVGAWHQEVRDISLILTRQLDVDCLTKLPRAHENDATLRLRDDCSHLAESGSLEAQFIVPDAAAPIDICADIGKRTITISMRVKAPDDRLSPRARLNWLLRQLKKCEDRTDMIVRLNWPGKALHTQYDLERLFDDPELVSASQSEKKLLSFDIMLVKELHGRFGQRRNFIKDLEDAVPHFYDQVGQHIKAYQRPAPQLREERADPDSVTPKALQAEAEQRIEP